MLNKIKNKKAVTAALLILIAVSAFLIYGMRRDDVEDKVTIATRPPQPEQAIPKLEVNKGSEELLPKLTALKGIALKQGKIEIKGDAIVPKPGAAQLEPSEKAEPEKRAPLDNPYVNVSLLNRSGKIISSEMIEKEREDPTREIMQVENMGKPRGVSIKPQSVKSLAQEGVSSQFVFPIEFHAIFPVKEVGLLCK